MTDGPRAVADRPRRRCVVLAPDKFKGSLSATGAAASLREGILSVVGDAEIRVAPVADGGEGTVEAALASGFTPLQVRAAGPDGSALETVVAVRGRTAVVELAQASGLQLVAVADRRPLSAGSRGTGEMILAALDAGCDTVVLGIGGSAGTDGGAGLVQALGVRLLDSVGQELPPGGAALARLDAVDLTTLDPRVGDTAFIVASDVDHVLLGAGGAAAVFGPQKGADPDAVAQLEAGLRRWAELVARAVGRDHSTAAGAGASGGVGFAALALLGAQLRPGIEIMLEMTGFRELLDGADLVVTGEGSLDEQSLGGKAPVGVARAAGELGVRTVAVAGVTSLSDDRLRAAGFARTYTLQQLEPDLARCLSDAGPLLSRVGAAIARDWLVPGP